jgi:large subunit ribosomal protein L1
MGRPSKRTREIAKMVDPLKAYPIQDAIELLKKCPPVKFDQSVDISLIMGVDPRRSDQLVRALYRYRMVQERR